MAPATFVIISIRCYAEPLERFTQSHNAAVQLLTTQGKAVVPGGLVPDHDYLVLELRFDGQHANNQHRFCRLDFVDEDGGKVTVTLHPSFCSACRRDLRGDAHLKEKWRVEFGCSCGRACTHTLEVIQTLLPDFTGRYNVLTNNCKAFVMAVLQLLVGAGRSACLSAEQLHELGSHLKDARLVDAVMHKFAGASGGLQQHLSSSTHSSRRR